VLKLLILQNIFIIPIETLFLKDLTFLFIRQHKLRNDAQLRIATITGFSR